MPSFITSSRTTGGLSRVNSIQRKWDDDGDDDIIAIPNPNSTLIHRKRDHNDDDDIVALPNPNSNSIQRKRDNGDDDDIIAIPNPNSTTARTNDENIPPHRPSSSQPLQIPSSALSWSPSPERVKRKMSNPVASNSVASSSVPPPPVMEETPAARRRRVMMEALSQGVAARTPTSSSSRPTSSSSRPVQPATSLPSIPSSRPFARSNSRPWEEGISSGKKVNDLLSSNASVAPLRVKATKATVGPTVKVRGKIFLSTEQQKVLQLVQEGKNVFFTGSAGTGKSVLLREIITALRRKYAKTPDAVAVTASTGIAACNIGGVTLHSFGGCGLALEPAAELAKKVRMNRKGVSRWMRTKVLIIDEVSMVDGELFDKFNKLGQIIRKKPDKAFGGIQLVVTGDFFQLPPVTKGGKEPSFCFEAQTWESTVDMSINLNKVFRQSDERFIGMLNEMRFGKLTQTSIQAFKDLERPIIYDDGISATELFPRREDVDRSNNLRLEALNTDGWSYESTDGGSITDPAQREKMLSNFMAPAHIFLKIDAQVMLIKNVDETLVNGSMGKVIGFCHRAEYGLDSTGAWREGDLFGEDGEDDEESSNKRQRLMDNIRSKISPNAKPYPVVRFNVPGGQRDMLVEPDTFKTELPNGEVQVSRNQIPLILAWAMSIHKAQGQTLDRVKVDLSKVFEKGQAYVALSRATSLDGLEVRGFRAEKVMVHRKVANWTTKLKSLSD